MSPAHDADLWSRLGRFWASVKVAERAESLRQARRRFANVESLTLQTRRKLLGDEAMSVAPGDEDAMHIGDDNRVVHQHSAANPWWPLMAGALGGGAIAWAALMGLSQQAMGTAHRDSVAPPAVTPPWSDTDTDTVLELSLP